MTYFIKSGSTFRVTSKESMDLHEALPAGNFVVKVDDTGRFFLERVDDFSVPVKVYGNCIKNANRIITTFNDRSGSTGVMLTGEKGSGKTLLSKKISVDLARVGVPTIIVNEQYTGDSFNTLIQSIEQPCVILFDEFEKVYDAEHQEHILTLLDGVFPTKKLFILTCNDKWRVDTHMRNRPGRIFYMIDFRGLDAGFIAEYCEDSLSNKLHIDRVVSLSGLFSEFNFDMLKALVEEMNRYDEDPAQAMVILNAKPEFDQGTVYTVACTIGETPIELDDHYATFEGNPIGTSGVRIGLEMPVGDIPDSAGRPIDSERDVSALRITSRWKELTLTQEHLVTVDSRIGRFVFEVGALRFTLTRKKEKVFNYVF